MYPIAAAPTCHRHRPEHTELYSIINEHYPRFLQEIERSGGHLPRFVGQEFEDYVRCGLLEHGFLRPICDGCRHEHLVAFSCKRRGFCPSCGARRIVESAAHLVDHVFPEEPVRQWVLTFPIPLRVLLAAHPQTSMLVSSGMEPLLSALLLVLAALAVLFSLLLGGLMFSALPAVAWFALALTSSDPWLAGGAILADGRVGLILDVHGVFNIVSRS